MFCPQCKTEYRQEFTECSDCGVALVENLGESSANVEGMELLWAGNDPRAYQEYRLALQTAGIAFTDEPPGQRFLYTSLRPPLEIWTHRRDHEVVKKVRQEILGDDDPAQETPEYGSDTEASFNTEGGYQKRTEPFWLRSWTTKAIKGEASQEQETPELVDSEEPEEDSADDIIEDFKPEAATAEVWSGEEAMARMFESCLRENGIGCVIAAANDTTKVFVLPNREARAKEIVREVMDATPPE